MHKANMSECTRPWFVLVLVAVLCAMLLPHAASSQVVPKTGKSVSPDLIALYESQKVSGQAAQTPDGLLKPAPLARVRNGRVVVDAIASGDADMLLVDLEALGLQKGKAYGRIVSGELPIESIGDLAVLSTLRFIRPSYATTHAGLVTSQGDVAMNSDDVRLNFGLDGTGVTVGVLSDTAVQPERRRDLRPVRADGLAQFRQRISCIN